MGAFTQAGAQPVARYRLHSDGSIAPCTIAPCTETFEITDFATGDLTRNSPDFSKVGGRPNVPGADDILVEAHRIEIDDPRRGHYEMFVVTRIIRILPGPRR